MSTKLGHHSNQYLVPAIMSQLGVKSLPGLSREHLNPRDISSQYSNGEPFGLSGAVSRDFSGYVIVIQDHRDHPFVVDHIDQIVRNREKLVSLKDMLLVPVELWRKISPKIKQLVDLRVQPMPEEADKNSLPIYFERDAADVRLLV